MNFQKVIFTFFYLTFSSQKWVTLTAAASAAAQKESQFIVTLRALGEFVKK